MLSHGEQQLAAAGAVENIIEQAGVDENNYNRCLLYTSTFVSEYGGIKWVVGEQDENAWGYGNAPRTENEFIERYRGLTEALLGNELMFGFCYTQLYDIEQEQNGLYTYDREPKFDMTVFHGINSAKAAIEE